MEQRVLRTVTLRLVPFLVLLYVIAYIDRSNVGFAKLTLQKELNLSAAVFTAGQMFFFIAYALFEVPSNLFLDRFGARRWFARIMITWGVVTVLTMFVASTWQFYLARFALGLAEAGFYPGLVYLFTKWFPQHYRGRVVGWLMLGQPLAFIVGNPFMGWLDDLHGTFGLAGWQLIFLFTGLPAVLLGLVTLRVVPDGPEKASWLSSDQKQWIADTLAAENATLERQAHNPLRALGDRRVLALALYFLCFPIGVYGLSFWLPTIVKGFGKISSFNAGLITDIPYLFVAVGLIVVPRLADRTGRPYRYMWTMSALGAVGLAASVLIGNHVLQVLMICLAAFGMYSAQPVMWSLPSRFLHGATAAAGIAMVNSIGNLGGGFGPMGIGVIVDATGSAVTGLWFLVGAMVLATVGTFGIRRLVEGSRGAAQAEQAVPAG
jgi:MFS family permease